MWLKPCRCGQEPADADKNLRMNIKALRLRLRILLCSLTQGSTDSFCPWPANYKQRKFCAENVNLDIRSSKDVTQRCWVVSYLRFRITYRSHMLS